MIQLVLKTIINCNLSVSAFFFFCLLEIMKKLNILKEIIQTDSFFKFKHWIIFVNDPERDTCIGITLINSSQKVFG